MLLGVSGTRGTICTRSAHDEALNLGVAHASPDVSGLTAGRHYCGAMISFRRGPLISGPKLPLSPLGLGGFFCSMLRRRLALLVPGGIRRTERQADRWRSDSFNSLPPPLSSPGLGGFSVAGITISYRVRFSFADAKSSQPAFGPTFTGSAPERSTETSPVTQIQADQTRSIRAPWPREPLAWRSRIGGYGE